MPKLNTHRRSLICALSASLAGGLPCTSAGAQTDATRASATWRRLRHVRGHFQGAAWNNEVDRWQGAKHQAMQVLAEHAHEKHWSEAELRRIMGTPDATLKSGQTAHTEAGQRAQWQGPAAPTTATLLVYNWRAQRDRLVLALQDGQVVSSGWLYDFE